MCEKGLAAFGVVREDDRRRTGDVQVGWKLREDHTLGSKPDGRCRVEVEGLLAAGRRC